jgi:hypothetical protein
MNVAPVKTTSDIKVAFPEAANRHLKFAVGACRLNLKPGEGKDWVSGTYDEPERLPHRIMQDGGTVRITQEFNAVDLFGPWSSPPTFDLALGKGKPYALTIESGAGEFQFDLGGLPITQLELKHGADKMELDFSASNPQPLSLIDIASGAGSTEIKNLANANFAEMKVEGGAAGYVLDFGGVLQRDAQVRIQTGLASVELLIPQTTAAKITCESVLGGVEVGNGFMKKDGAFVTQAALDGKTPVLFIYANVALGGVKIQTI